MDASDSQPRKLSRHPSIYTHQECPAHRPQGLPWGTCSSSWSLSSPPRLVWALQGPAVSPSPLPVALVSFPPHPTRPTRSQTHSRHRSGVTLSRPSCLPSVPQKPWPHDHPHLWEAFLDKELWTQLSATTCAKAPQKRGQREEVLHERLGAGDGACKRGSPQSTPGLPQERVLVTQGRTKDSLQIGSWAQGFNPSSGPDSSLGLVFPTCTVRVGPAC